MAARTLYPDHTPHNFSASQWKTDDAGGGTETKPVAGDTIILTVNSGKVTCDETWAAATMSATGAAEWDFGVQTATLSGIVTLDNITATMAAASITASEFDIGAGGTLTLSDDATFVANFELDGGTIDTGGNTLALTGDLIRTSGTTTELNVDHTGPANASYDTGLGYWNIVVGTITQTGSCRCTKLRVASGATLAQGTYLHYIDPTANDFLDIEVGATVTQSTARIDIRPTTAYSNAGRIVCPSLAISGQTTGVITQTGVVDLSVGMVVRGVADNHAPQYVVGSDGQSLGAVVLGMGGSNRAGKIDFGAFNTEMASLVTGLDSDDTTPNVVDCGSGTITLAGTFDGESAGDGPVDMTVDSTNAKFIGAGSLTNVVMNSGNIYAPIAMDGGGNDVTAPDRVIFMPDGVMLGLAVVGGILSRRG